MYGKKMGSKLFWFQLLMTIRCIQECSCAPFPARVIKEVRFRTEDERAGASSSYSSGLWSKPKSAFRQDIKEAWQSGYQDRKPFPHLVWYNFPEESAFVPAEVSFRPRQDSEKEARQVPSKWQFVGTNDAVCNEDSAWTILCEDLSGVEGTGFASNKFCRVAPELNRKFRCLGIRILESGSVAASLNSLRFWKKAIES